MTNNIHNNVNENISELDQFNKDIVEHYEHRKMYSLNGVEKQALLDRHRMLVKPTVKRCTK